jgi:hypothetical protein
MTAADWHAEAKMADAYLNLGWLGVIPKTAPGPDWEPAATSHENLLLARRHLSRAIQFHAEAVIMAKAAREPERSEL